VASWGFHKATNQEKANQVMAKYHLLHDYIQLADAPLGDVGLHVAAEMAGNANFPNPKVKPADLKAASQAFLDAVAVCQDGTKQDTIHKNNLRDALIVLLDTNLADVELTAQNNPEVMKSSGYNLANSGGAKPAPVGTVAITGVTNIAGGSLNLTLDMSSNVWGVEVQVSTASGVWVPAGYFTDPRNVTPTNLTPGTMYAIRARVHGSYNQISDWSDTVSHMAT
jgi:hypothetical protein